MPSTRPGSLPTEAADDDEAGNEGVAASPPGEPQQAVEASSAAVQRWKTQRGLSNFGQKLAHQTSTDLVTWGPVVDDATGTTYAERPGMTSVAHLRGDLWIMTFEYGQPVDPVNPNQADYTYHVHYRLAKDPESFRFSETIPVLDPNGYAPNAAPIVSWSDSGGPNGTIVVTDNDDADFFINRDLGDPAKWTRLSSPMPRGYSRYTIPLDGPGSPENRGLVFVITGAPYGTSAPIDAGIISVAG